MSLAEQLGLTVLGEWAEDANCRGVDPALFYPERGDSTAVAKAVCAGCTVRGDCLQYALDHGEKHGIWGGTSERARRRMRKNMRTRPRDDGRRNRERILASLSTAEMSTSEIARATGLGPQTTLGHLRTLEAAGRVRITITGRGQSPTYWQATHKASA